MTISSVLLLVVGVLVVAALAVAVVRAGRHRSRALADAGIAPGAASARRVGTWITVGGVAVLAVAVAGPTARLPVGREAGTVILAMDVSNSMAATDVQPSRLKAAQQAAVDFIGAQPDNVNIGVVGFDQGALATALPTADHSAAVTSVQSLHISGGTSLSAAILASVGAITGKAVAVGPDGSLPDLGYWPSATIVLISDGEDQARAADSDTDPAVVAATAAENAGIHIDTIGVGTAAGTSLTIGEFQVHTALDAQELTTIAQTAGGSYHPVSSAADLDGIAHQIDLRLTVAPQDVPLAGAFIVLAVLLLLGGATMTVLRTGRLV